MSQITFEGRVAIVTGGASGLGREYCLALARRGAQVVVNDLGTSGGGRGSSGRPAEDLVRHINDAGGQAIANADSVATRTGGAQIVQCALDHFGRVDIVINNAGIVRNARFEDLTDAEINALLDVHVSGAFHVSQPAYRSMRRQKYGRFLFTSSGSALYGHPFQANYAAAKGALAALSNVVALEGRQHGILSNALLPMATTRLADEMHPEQWSETRDVSEVFERWMSEDVTLMGKHLVADRVAPLMLYLVSERCRTTHGLYSAVAGRYARVFVGLTSGWFATEDQPATPEDIEAHWAEVEDRSNYSLPQHIYDELRIVGRQFRERANRGR